MADSPETMIKNILSNPETMNKLNSVLSNLKDSGTVQEKSEESVPALPSENAQMMLKLGQIMSGFSETDDNGIRLITALKPYLSGKRAESAETAIKILKLSKMTSLLENIDL